MRLLSTMPIVSLVPGLSDGKLCRACCILTALLSSGACKHTGSHAPSAWLPVGAVEHVLMVSAGSSPCSSSAGHQ